MSPVRLLILPGYYLPHIGGVETHVDEFAKYLTRDPRFSVTILAPNIPKTQSYEIRHNRVEIYRYPAFEIIPNYPVPKLWSPSFWKILFKLKKSKFDFIMTRTRFFISSLIGLLIAKLPPKTLPLIHVEHGSSYVTLESKWKTKIAYYYDRILGKLILHKADLVIAISEAVQEFLKKEFSLNSVPIIRRGIEITQIDAIPPASLIDYSNYFLIGYVGRLFKWKGVENLIKAFFLLPEKIRVQSKLIIVGYGEDENRLKKLTGKALGQEIIFTGKVSFEEAIALTKAFDLYVHPSGPGGGLATTLLQAMACGKAIVASPHEGAKEVIFDKETGVLLPDNASENIAKGIKFLFERPKLRAELGSSARKFVESNFSWEKQAEAFKKLLIEKCAV